MTVVAAAAIPIFDPGGLARKKTVDSVKVMMTEGMHDTAIITLRGEPTDVPELQGGTPVQMVYGWNSVDLDWFYGYIDHVESNYNQSLPNQSQFADVVCMGASYAMKDPYTGAWSNTKASTLVQEVANTYFISALVENDDYVWPQLSNPGYSAWTFLTQLANRTGYSLACNQTQVRFLSVDLGLRSFWPTMPVFLSRNVSPSPASQGISSFNAVTGESFTGPGQSKAVRSVAGIDALSGDVIRAADDGTTMVPLGATQVYPFFHKQVNEVVTSQGHAQASLAGHTQANRFPYQATATLSGMTVIKQGVPLVVSGIDTTNDGVWWVREVVHCIKTGSYTMDVCLGRDSKGDTGLRPFLGAAVAYHPKNPIAYAIANAPTTKLVSNRWHAAYAGNVNLS